MMHEYGSFGFMGFGFLYMLIFWGLVFYVIYWCINSSKIGTNNLSNNSPKEIIKKRLANGDITKKEYNEILKELEK